MSQDNEHEQTDYELRMAGQKVRRYTSVYDGDVSADFTSPEETYQPYPIGIIHKELEYNDIGNVRLWPLLLWCRPLHPALLDPEGLEVMKGVVRVQENVNIVLVTVSRTDNTIAQLWVDPAAGYTIKRYTALNDGKPTVVINITYTNDPVHGWIPAEWNTRMLKQDGSSVVSVGAKVTSIAINNRIPVETFRLVFPPNSRVGDFRAMEDYVVSDDGSKRVITKEELEAGFTINELKAKKPGETLRAHDPSWRYPLLWLNLLVIGIIVLWMVFRSYRHRL